MHRIMLISALLLAAFAASIEVLPNAIARANNSSVVTGYIDAAAQFKVVADGVTDQTAKINAAILFLQPNGGIVRLPPGNIIGSPTLLSNTVLEGAINGLTTLSQTSGSVIKAVGSIGPPISLTANAGPGSTTLSILNTKGLAVGDWIVVADQYAYNSSDRSYYSGESANIASVDSSTQITLRNPLYGPRLRGMSYTVANGSRILKVMPIVNIGVRNLSVRGIGLPAGNVNLFDFRWVKGVLLENVKGSNTAGSGVFLLGVREVRIENITISDGIDDAANGHPGYCICIGGPSDNVDIRNIDARRCRHAVTTVGGHYGYVHGLYVHESTSRGTTVNAFDTHDAGHGIWFYNNKVINSLGGGFHTRSPYTYFYNNIVASSNGTGIAAVGDHIWNIMVKGNQIFGGRYGMIISANGPYVDISDNNINEVDLSGALIKVQDPKTLNYTHNHVFGFGASSPSQTGHSFISTGPTGGAIIRDNYVTTTHTSQYGFRLQNMTADGGLDNFVGAGTYTIARYDLGTGAYNLGTNRTPASPKFWQLTLADHAATSIVMSANYNLICSMGSASAGTGFPNVVFRASSNTSPQATKLTTLATKVAVTTGVLSGATGTRGNLTVSAAEDALYFENRTGRSSKFWVRCDRPIQ